jgi:hypothetical protein
MAQVTLTSDDLLASILEVEKRVAKCHQFLIELEKKVDLYKYKHLVNDYFDVIKGYRKFYDSAQKARVVVLVDEDLVEAATALKSLQAKAEGLERKTDMLRQYMPKPE